MTTMTSKLLINNDLWKKIIKKSNIFLNWILAGMNYIWNSTYLKNIFRYSETKLSILLKMMIQPPWKIQVRFFFLFLNFSVFISLVTTKYFFYILGILPAVYLINNQYIFILCCVQIASDTFKTFNNVYYSITINSLILYTLTNNFSLLTFHTMKHVNLKPMQKLIYFYYLLFILAELVNIIILNCFKSVVKFKTNKTRYTDLYSFPIPNNNIYLHYNDRY